LRPRTDAGALGAYSFDMAGKSERKKSGWAVDHLAEMRAQVDDCVAALKDCDTPKGDVEIGRRLRCVMTVTRAVVLVDRHLPRPEEKAVDVSEDGGDERDDDPVELARLHAELRARLEGTQRTLDARRRRDRELGAGHAAGGDGLARAA
jgi:hypothetical protein